MVKKEPILSEDAQAGLDKCVREIRAILAKDEKATANVTMPRVQIDLVVAELTSEECGRVRFRVPNE